MPYEENVKIKKNIKIDFRTDIAVSKPFVIRSAELSKNRLQPGTTASVQTLGMGAQTFRKLRRITY